MGLPVTAVAIKDGTTPTQRLAIDSSGRASVKYSRKLVYVASSALTITLASLAASSTLVAGREATLVDNTSNLYLDYAVSGLVTTGTSPTAGYIEVWAVAKMDDSNWPDGFTGADSARTTGSRDILMAHARLISAVPTSASSNIGYPFSCVSIASLFGGSCPAIFTVWVVHSTVAALNATGGNQRITVKPLYATAT